MFANRIAKNFKHLKKWAKNAGVECFRIYDRDIPELPFALDLYSDRAHLQEYSRPAMDVRGQRRWLTAMHEAAARALNIPLERVVLKQRHGQRPDDQYRKLAASAQDFVVREGGNRFIVDLTGHLDTGLFLDHRQTRALVGTLARRQAGLEPVLLYGKLQRLRCQEQSRLDYQRRPVENLSRLDKAQLRTQRTRTRAQSTGASRCLAFPRRGTQVKGSLRTDRARSAQFFEFETHAGCTRRAARSRQTGSRMPFPSGSAAANCCSRPTCAVSAWTPMRLRISV